MCMATKRTGHYGGPRPPGGWPSQIEQGIRLRNRTLVAVIRTRAREQNTEIETLVAERFGVHITPSQPSRRRRGGKAATPES